MHDRLDKYKALHLEAQDEFHHDLVKLEVNMMKKFNKQNEQINSMQEKFQNIENQITEEQDKSQNEALYQRKHI